MLKILFVFTFPFNKILAYLMLATPNFVNIAIKNKISKILKKNPGFEKMCQFESMFSWEKVQGKGGPQCHCQLQLCSYDVHGL